MGEHQKRLVRRSAQSRCTIQSSGGLPNRTRLSPQWGRLMNGTMETMREMVKAQQGDLRSHLPREGKVSDSLSFVFLLRGAEPSIESSRGSGLTPGLEASTAEEEPRRRDEVNSSEECTDFQIERTFPVSAFMNICARKEAVRTDLPGMGLASWSWV
jgi:hypothetical protein